MTQAYLRNRYYDPSTGRFISEDTHWNTENCIYGDAPGDNPTPDIAAIMQSNNLYVYCRNNPVMWCDRSGLATVAIRDYTIEYGGTVNWDDVWDVAAFSISGITLWSTGPGYNNHNITITNIGGRLYADDYELDAFLGQALTWGHENGNAGNIASGGLAIGGSVSQIDSPIPGPADAAGVIIAGGAVLIAGGVGVYELATGQNGKYGDATVKDVLKHRKGSIKQAPLPPGTPGWDKLLPLTMEAIRRAADKGETGMKTIWKLLNDNRFYK